jgi:hypothetical protein
MRDPRRHSLVLTYVYLAAGCVLLGTVLTFALLAVCARLEVDVFRNLWLLAIPSVLSVLVNVLLVELYDRFRWR